MVICQPQPEHEVIVRPSRVCVKTQALRQGTPSGVPQVRPFQYLFICSASLRLAALLFICSASLRLAALLFILAPALRLAALLFICSASLRLAALLFICSASLRAGSLALHL